MRGRKIAIGAGLTSIAMACAVCLQSTGDAVLYLGQQIRSLPIYGVQTEEKKIAISFDCAWGTEHTDEILKALDEEEITATWFMVEFWTTKYPEYVKKISDAGHEIGTHSRTHSYMSKLAREDIMDELKTSSEAITSITGKEVELFRPPYGDYDDLLIDTAKEMGIFSIQWDIDSLDWKDLSAGEISSRIISKAHSGAIILCHNNGLHTAEALPVIFRTLKNQGYTFVPIGTLIYHSNFIINSNGEQIPIENT